MRKGRCLIEVSTPVSSQYQNGERVLRLDGVKQRLVRQLEAIPKSLFLTETATLRMLVGVMFTLTTHMACTRTTPAVVGAGIGMVLTPAVRSRGRQEAGLQRPL